VSISEFAATLNEYGAQRVPFLFFVDFEMERPRVFKLNEIDERRIRFNINGNTNFEATPVCTDDLAFSKEPQSYQEYKKKFDKVWSHLLYGDSYLTNLTIKTRVSTNKSLQDLFLISEARYKLWFDDEFVVFSPETFVRIFNNYIYSYPMKGTIDADIPDAEKKILSDVKEKAEHVTIVDLIRNDLSSVSNDVSVTRFRYVERISTLQKNLLQVSSEIRGTLTGDPFSRLGDILLKLLPAGSVSGAPKAKTLSIIRSAEGEPRGYYTGVLGLFDGKSFDSGVMIRFLEREGEILYYRSGGGITAQSTAQQEYQEAIDKVYVPVN
jgi:para-aminobenzoate synthetase component 1